MATPQEPSFLPSAASRKWHTRRWRDPLGYFRVRTLANPRWQRDIGHVITMLNSGRRTYDQALVDQALVIARAYRHRRNGRHGDAVELDRMWTELIAAIDKILENAQAEHLDKVKRAGRSGL